MESKFRLKVSKPQLRKLVAGKSLNHNGSSDGNFEVVLKTDPKIAARFSKKGRGIVGGRVVKFREVGKSVGGKGVPNQYVKGLDKVSGNFLAPGRSWSGKTGKGFVPIGGEGFVPIGGSGFLPLGGSGFMVKGNTKYIKYPEQS